MNYYTEIRDVSQDPVIPSPYILPYASIFGPVRDEQNLQSDSGESLLFSRYVLCSPVWDDQCCIPCQQQGTSLNLEKLCNRTTTTKKSHHTSK